MEWLIVLGMFLITAFATFGFFANIEDARRQQKVAAREAFLAAVGQSELSAKLTEELRAIAESGESADEWLQRTRVPYGHCLLEEVEDCDKKTRCVQCEQFETTSADAPALKALLEQELDLAEHAEERGMKREADIHRTTATSIESHLRQFGKLELVG
jgi:hypothetical protein